MKRIVFGLLALFAIAISLGVCHAVGVPVTVDWWQIDSYLVKYVDDNTTDWTVARNIDMLVKHDAPTSRTIVMSDDIWHTYFIPYPDPGWGQHWDEKFIDCPDDETVSLAPNTYCEVSAWGGTNSLAWAAEPNLCTLWAAPDEYPSGPVLITNPTTNCAGIMDYDFPAPQAAAVTYYGMQTAEPSADDFNCHVAYSYDAMADITWPSPDLDISPYTSPRIVAQYRDFTMWPETYRDGEVLVDLGYQKPSGTWIKQTTGVKWISTSLNPPEWGSVDIKNAQNVVIGWKAKVRIAFEALCTDDLWYPIQPPVTDGFWVYHYN
jgi:hypothetical protein